MKRHILIGIGATLLLLSVYVGIITWAEGFEHAVTQTVDLWYWVAALAAGFGVQAGLFSFLRHGLRQRKASTTASVATSGSVSAGSMIACCAHHVTDVLPITGTVQSYCLFCQLPGPVYDNWRSGQHCRHFLHAGCYSMQRPVPEIK